MNFILKCGTNIVNSAGLRKAV